jgi:GAF domain-containing protein
MLHVLAERLRSLDLVMAVFDAVLERGLEVTGVTFGNVQAMNWKTGCLEIAAQRGFQYEFLKFFERVKADDQSACAHALRTRGQIIIGDVSNDKGFSPISRDIVLSAGIKAVQSTPIISSSGAFIGMLSTHYPRVHVPSVNEMATLTALAQVAADAIIAKRAHDNESQRIERTVLAIRSSRELLARVNGVGSNAERVSGYPRGAA